MIEEKLKASCPARENNSVICQKPVLFCGGERFRDGNYFSQEVGGQLTNYMIASYFTK